MPPLFFVFFFPPIFFYGIQGLKLIEDINLLYVTRLAQEVKMVQKEKKIYMEGREVQMCCSTFCADGNFHWGAPSGSLLTF